MRVLGKGLTATVYAAKRFSDQSTIAIKAFKKSTFYPKQNGKGKVLLSLIIEGHREIIQDIDWMLPLEHMQLSWHLRIRKHNLLNNAELPQILNERSQQSLLEIWDNSDDGATTERG